MTSKSRSELFEEISDLYFNEDGTRNDTPMTTDVKRFCVGDHSFYNEYNAYNDDGSELISTTRSFAEKIIKEFMDKGYSPREISHLMHAGISSMESEIVLRNAMKMRKLVKDGEKKALEKKAEGKRNEQR